MSDSSEKPKGGHRFTHWVSRDLVDKDHPCRDPLDLCDILRHEVNHVIFGQLGTGALHDIRSRLLIFAAEKGQTHCTMKATSHKLTSLHQ